MRSRAFAGEPVDFAMRDPVSGRVIATVTSPFYGPKIWYHRHDPAGEWTQAEGVALPEGGEHALERIWVIVAGEARLAYTPAATRGSCSRAATAAPPGSSTLRCGSTGSTEDWQPGGGGLCLHSIVPWPGRARQARGRGVRRRRVADRGSTAHVAEGQPRASVPATCPRRLPEETFALCVHRMERAPPQPERMFIQFHGGVYRSDDARRVWSEIGVRPAVGLRLPARRSTRATPTAPT